jgi:hypothetical protein
MIREHETGAQGNAQRHSLLPDLGRISNEAAHPLSLIPQPVRRRGLHSDRELRRAGNWLSKRARVCIFLTIILLPRTSCEFEPTLLGCLDGCQQILFDIKLIALPCTRRRRRIVDASGSGAATNTPRGLRDRRLCEEHLPPFLNEPRRQKAMARNPRCLRMRPTWGN